MANFRWNRWLRQRKGFTLIEVLVSVVLIAIFAYGVTAIWVTVDDLFYRLTLRQKAIFVANSQLETLANLWRYYTYAGNPDTGNGSSTVGLIYQGEAGNTMDLTDLRGGPNSAPAVLTALYNVGPPAKYPIASTNIGDFTRVPYRTVLLVAGAAGANNRNVVWLDTPRRDAATGAITSGVTARISWNRIGVGNVSGSATNQNFPKANNCVRGNIQTPNECSELVFILQYPFRYQDANNPDLDTMGHVTSDDIIIRTIVWNRY